MTGLDSLDLLVEDEWPRVTAPEYDGFAIPADSRTFRRRSSGLVSVTGGVFETSSLFCELLSERRPERMRVEPFDGSSYDPSSFPVGGGGSGSSSSCDEAFFLGLIDTKRCEYSF